RNSTSWPSHSYRAAMTGIIAGAISDRDQGVLVVDDAIEKELQVASSEIDQAEIVRRSNFLAVCRALAFDNWIVRYELAQLGFRRRQHASADSNFRIAATRCPARARFAVLQAQWVNLTWLSHSRGGHVSLHPEALEAGYAAIQAAGPHDRPAAGAIQVWLATNAPDLDVMDPVDVEAAGPYTRGLASEALGDGVGAIRCWLRALETSYEPRAAHKLIELCERCNFTQTVQGIVDLLLRESNDDFFALWELGKVLLWQRRARELTSGHLDQKIRIIAERLEVMSRYEFQHLMRAFEFFTLQNREDRAASMLARAASLAEGFEDNLSVAIERRNLLAPTDVIGRRCLQRAAREAGERFEKLQVARELFAYGETRRAREILTELGAFRDCGDFDHAERIIVLQCAHWLGEDEAGRFACETAESLRWASGHGAFSRYGNAFWKRLHENVTKSQVKRFDAATLEWWKEQMSLNGGQPKRGIAEVELHDDMMGRISAQPLEWNLHAWSYVANELDTTFAGLAKVQPTAEESETPTSESIDTASDWRGQEISDRWRSYFAAKTDADASLKLDAVRQFFVEEARLVELWEAKRRVARAPFLGLVTRFAGFASRILESLSESRDELEKWPMLAGFFQNVRTDAAIQRQRIEARLPALASDPCTPEVAPEIAT
ncbi:MAG TPA: hypothetical protein VKB34_14880, partial [Povalibacter sp.]|nr:hypothetical protein [Povalibacter sp.]